MSRIRKVEIGPLVIAFYEGMFILALQRGDKEDQLVIDREGPTWITIRNRK